MPEAAPEGQPESESESESEAEEEPVGVEVEPGRDVDELWEGSDLSLSEPESELEFWGPCSAVDAPPPM